MMWLSPISERDEDEKRYLGMLVRMRQVRLATEAASADKYEVPPDITPERFHGMILCVRKGNHVNDDVNEWE